MKKPSKPDKEKIAGKFKSTFNLSDLQAERCANTFLALVELSEIPAGDKILEQGPLEGPPPQLPINDPSDFKAGSGRVIGLKYDIAIHLPATKDIEVYNAIFKSLKEHLVD